MKKVIVHSGEAHRDEFLSLGLAVHAGLITETTPIERRDPTDAELDDPDVLVLDVGGRLDVWRSNYDHHQLARGTEECTLSLLGQSMSVRGQTYTYHELLADQLWYRATIVLDSLGPFELAKRAGLKKLPAETWSPVESAMLSMFEQDPQLGLQVAAGVVTQLVGAAIKAKQQVEEICRVAEDHDVEGLQVVRIPLKDAEFFEDYLRLRNQNPAVLVFNDNRGQGFCLYRRNDHPKVDFSRIETNPAVTFAHKGGFIAKTQSLLDDWKSLVAAAIV